MYNKHAYLYKYLHAHMYIHSYYMKYRYVVPCFLNSSPKPQSYFNLGHSFL